MAIDQSSPLLTSSVVWECPVCYWHVPSGVMEFIRIDPECPGCGCRFLSEFVPVAGCGLEDLW